LSTLASGKSFLGKVFLKTIKNTIASAMVSNV